MPQLMNPILEQNLKHLKHANDMLPRPPAGRIAEQSAGIQYHEAVVK